MPRQLSSVVRFLGALRSRRVSRLRDIGSDTIDIMALKKDGRNENTKNSLDEVMVQHIRGMNVNLMSARRAEPISRGLRLGFAVEYEVTSLAST